MAYTTIDDPTAYFQTKLYTGNDSSRAITFDGNTNMQPDWSWFKARSEAYNHAAFDSVRGTTKLIRPNQDVLEETHSTTLTAFGSNGFSLGGGDAFTNANTVTYASWHWKAGTSVSGTTTGTGTGKAYSGSVNTDAGFSIITYVANGTAGHTIPHHLGAAPKWVICKSRSENRGFPIQHASLTDASYSVYLTTNAAQSNGTNSWNSTAASSSVVTLGDNANNNKDNDSYIMYSFAEKQGYSKFGSYTGNGNADGAYVHLGFKPAVIIIKRTDSTGNWNIIDNKRLGRNPNNPRLTPNATTAEDSADATTEILSNGFKLIATSQYVNYSGGSYIYMAFAENPFVTSSGVPACAR